MVKIKSSFSGKSIIEGMFKKTIEKIIEKAKNDKINELKRKGLYKPGVTKVIVTVKDSADKWRKTFRR